MAEEIEQDGWRVWSKHILKGLERLDGQLEELRGELSSAKLDIVKLGFLNNKIDDIEEKVENIKREVKEQKGFFAEAIKSIENDLQEESERTIDANSELNKRLSKMEEFISIVKIIGSVIGSILLALLGMISFNLKDFLN
jgi:chromosome segregation ATPase